MEKKKKFIHRLRNKYRLVIMNEDTFEEKASLTLTQLNVFVVFSSLMVLFLGLFAALFLYTPLKEYIPGCINEDQTRLLIELQFRVDSLEKVAIENEAMMMIKRDILLDRVDSGIHDSGSHEHDSLHGDLNLQPSEKEMQLRENLQPERDYMQLTENGGSGASLFAPFFSPLRGTVSAKFDRLTDHPATDIVSNTDQTVKATLDGTVVIASWTPETGNVIALQHDNNLISVYKHNAVLLKKVGNFVDAGEAIAIVGNSGELSSGPHLHFEIWHNGLAVNPEDYVVFK